MPKIQLVCEKCKKIFDRKISEHNYSLNKGRKSYCSRKCVGDINRIPVEKRTANKVDEYSPFRYHLKNCKKRMLERKYKLSNKLFDIDLPYLKSIWEKQKGICPLTGWEMENMKSHSDLIKLTPKRASLDRIDNNKGYTQGNVRFICYMAQCAKNVFLDEDVKNFAKAICHKTNL